VTEPGATTARVGVVIPAAGAGRRMGGLRKPWLELSGDPVLAHALRPFLADARVTAVRVALAADEAGAPPPWLPALDARIGVVAGGETRADSVAFAVAALPDDVEVIVVHDGARPLVTSAMVDRVIAVAAGGTGAVAGWPATDTLKRVAGGGRVVETPDRSALWHAQTPQGFPAAMLRAALARTDLRARATDDASLVEAAGGHVRMVEGSPWNLKVTRPADLPVAGFLLARVEAEGEPPLAWADVRNGEGER
jgi:2-C-methyl-D-erythritol 4-phosphate cytidylyltransferase